MSPNSFGDEVCRPMAMCVSFVGVCLVTVASLISAAHC